MNIAVLTSSRADFGIYIPLLKKIILDPQLNLNLIVFGTHLSLKYGLTINEIINEGFEIMSKVDTLPEGDNPIDIDNTISKTFRNFGIFWKTNQYNFDIVLCLGDRFEMFAAVFAGIPFGIKFAHIHGGEKTLGSNDNIYRHSITHASIIHFTSTDEYSKRVNNLLDSPNKKIYNVGALSLDNIKQFKPLSKLEMRDKYAIEFSNKTILVTLHPETTEGENKNIHNANIITSLALELKDYKFIISMPNADTFSECIRNEFNSKLINSSNVYLIENFGKIGYFSAMTYSNFLLGNSSSGIIEAASFEKYVINLGNRQDGRLYGENVFNCSFNKNEIIQLIKKIELLIPWRRGNIYYNGGAAEKIISILKNSI